MKNYNDKVSQIAEIYKQITQYLSKAKLTRACFLSRDQYALILECLKEKIEKEGNRQ